MHHAAMTINQEIRGAETPRAQKVMAAGGILGASRPRLAAFCRWRSLVSA
jgi:hypothetical protein